MNKKKIDIGRARRANGNFSFTARENAKRYDAHAEHLAANKSTRATPWYESRFFGGLKYCVEMIAIPLAIAAAVIGFYIWDEERDARQDERELWAEERLAREQERQLNQEERIARAWALLTTPATGNSGKIEALEFLSAQGVVLDGIDLSCERMGGGWDAEKMECARPVYLVGLGLQKAQLDGANLQGTNLSFTDLQGANLREADLQGAYLSEADLSRADLHRADLQGASLQFADLQGAYLPYADLQGANLDGVDLQGAYLPYADLQGADLGWADLQGADLQQSDLTGVNLHKTNLSGALLYNTELYKANLRGADLQHADFSTAKSTEFAHFEGAWAAVGVEPKGLAGITIDICPLPEGEIVLLQKPETGCVPTVMK